MRSQSKNNYFERGFIYFILGISYALASAFVVDELKNYDNVKYVIILSAWIVGVFALLSGIVAFGMYYFEIKKK